jgi:xylan 1,4-beta-xylosidase
VLNVFRMFGMMKGKRVKVIADEMHSLQTVIDSGLRGAHTDIGALAAKDKKEATVMIWNYHDDDIQNGGKTINITLNDIPGKVVTLTQYRIDDKHSNSYEVWKKMGSPQKPTEQQIKLLEQAGQLQTIGKPAKLPVKAGRLNTAINLPRQGVALLVVRW